MAASQQVRSLLTANPRHIIDPDPSLAEEANDGLADA
jgi:hypothetical protein